eukprot:CAMPEP_0202692672 /NCGR_PEP_ID=MMETSP1385-20130828/6992_1 /ASSEMBLY_ACC=CAM_ASM_000861 /TAXON_ID=933848 /ORGANISM="Elphidium margaritaceum" /LENGTH=202 /DNA_ID=CAMNT_0049348249 /DNA_START=87 /DNA_END=691 /DNA_ORIENTATION=-
MTVSNAWFLGVVAVIWSMLTASVYGQTIATSAQVWGTCDNHLTVERSDDGGTTYVDITSSLSGDANNWGELKTGVLDNLLPSAKLRITCRNADGDVGMGGLIFSVAYDGQYYSTDGARQNGGYYTLESASSGLTQTVSPPSSSYGSNALTAAPYNAQWTWTCGANGDWSNPQCPAGNTEVYIFSFPTAEPTTAEPTTTEMPT